MNNAYKLYVGYWLRLWVTPIFGRECLFMIDQFFH